MHTKTLHKLSVLVLGALSLSACQTVTQNLSSHFKSWSVVPLETAEMKAEKIDNTLVEKKVRRFEPKHGGHLGAFGLNLEPYLLRDNVGAPEQRLARLEKSVVELQKDLAILAPTVQDLTLIDRMAVPEHTHDHVHEAPPMRHQVAATETPVQLMALKSEDLIDAPATGQSVKHMATRPIESVMSKLNSPQTMQAQPMMMVNAVRTGAHPGLTRLVFDVSDDTPYRTDLDNNERLLVVEFPKSGWNPAILSRSFTKSRLLDSYKVMPMDGGGHIFALKLKKTSEIQNKSILPGAKGVGKRIVIDLRD